jgi:copper chaperone CopZ
MIRSAFLLLVAFATIVPPAQATIAPDRVYEVDVTLVSCAVCRKKIKEIFLAIDGVKDVEFDLKAKVAIVTMKGDKELKRATVDEAFRLSKYTVNGMKERPRTESKPSGSAAAAWFQVPADGEE